jgi:hypothetical protein
MNRFTVSSARPATRETVVGQTVFFPIGHFSKFVFHPYRKFFQDGPLFDFAKILILALAYFMMLLPYLLIVVSFLSINSVACWMPLGGSNFPLGMEGSVVDLSHDGLRLAVGSPSQDNGDGRISVYELDASGVNWQLLVEITGMPEEGLGDALSISPDGLLVAARRHHVTPNAVQVFQILESQPFVFHYGLLGPLVYCPVDGNGTEVQLSQTSLDPVSEYVLLLSCEDFESQRGMVQAYVLDRGTFFYSNEFLQWRPYLPPLTGDRPGDRFGHATALVHAPHPPPRRREPPYVSQWPPPIMIGSEDPYKFS